MLSEVKARYLVGLTATPQRRDGHHPITEMQLGPVRLRVEPQERGRAPAVRSQAHRPRDRFPDGGDDTDAGIQEIYRALASDEARNQGIVDGARPMVRHLVVLHGGMKAKQRRGSVDQLASIPETAERLALATSRYIGEGFDDARRPASPPAAKCLVPRNRGSRNSISSSMWTGEGTRSCETGCVASPSARSS